MPTEVPDRIMDATRACLLAEGYANLSTRTVARTAGVPVSQIHYHFGSKENMVLATLAHENQRLVARQRQMYATHVPLSKRYRQACDFLDIDITSGYVRILQEAIAAGWTERAVADQVLAMLRGWTDLLVTVAREAEERFGTLGPFTAEDVATLVAVAFIGGEALILLGDPDWSERVRTALRRFGDLIEEMEGRA
ncbi:TetR/AcrR family transcriptional regulator [Dactylosporangium sp. AC04546]|uniref:TetR/AcrR family transcriptional regulator n=1 Tax=Dactylosporangium sp. AC04546 TaxID=2862460 RepID=UPI001EDF91E4|nr:TetR/AcrR family transcriptional regulator [Dactylosporangium sp. AC04546]WVK88544.1 TetR/AcrR family transcriptional regulator [Dactylosporangium sp. AC04546]